MPTSPIKDQHLKQIQIRTIYLGLAIGRKQIRYRISLPGDEKYSWKHKKKLNMGFILSDGVPYSMLQTVKIRHGYKRCPL